MQRVQRNPEKSHHNRSHRTITLRQRMQSFRIAS